VDVALDGADHHLADARRAGFGQERLQDRHAALHRVGGHQHLGDEEDAVAEIVADDGHAAHERLGEDVVGRPAAVQQDVHALFDLFLQTVVEVVEHLGDQIVVVELREDDVVFFLGHGRVSCGWCDCTVFSYLIPLALSASRFCDIAPASGDLCL
jgi:hypothetical protein